MRARAARRALERDRQRRRTAEQHGGQLRRRDAVAQREPGAVDAGRERVDGEVGDGAVVGQRLHQRQRDAAGDRRARQRQLDAPECAPRRRSPSVRAASISAGGRSTNAVRASR